MPRTSVRERTPPVISKLLTPFEEFNRAQSLGGLLLLVATIAALVMANSPWAPYYFALRDLEMNLSIGRWHGHTTVQHLINDGLMAIFFFVVGLEIKRELLIGELNPPQKAILPIVAAIGGMLFPAAIFLMFNYGQPTVGAWAVPMATDIAFALGILALMGSRAPMSAKVFLTSLAIIDDLGAVLVIAFFYTGNIAWQSLGIAAFLTLLLVLCNRTGIKSHWIYGTIGILVWLFLSASGIHSTIAGIVVAATIPVVSRIDVEKFRQISQMKLLQFDKATARTRTPLLDNEQSKAIHELESAVHQVQPPMMRLQHIFHPASTYFIIPAFAFCNAGIPLAQTRLGFDPLTLGILLGFLVGKPLGIVVLSWAAIRLRWAPPLDLPKIQFVGVAMLGGIGFTMALFISNLAFAKSLFVNSSTAAILLASLFATIIGAALIYFGGRTQRMHATLEVPVK